MFLLWFVTTTIHLPVLSIIFAIIIIVNVVLTVVEGGPPDETRSRWATRRRPWQERQSFCRRQLFSCLCCRLYPFLIDWVTCSLPLADDNFCRQFYHLPPKNCRHSTVYYRDDYFCRHCCVLSSNCASYHSYHLAYHQLSILPPHPPRHHARHLSLLRVNLIAMTIMALSFADMIHRRGTHGLPRFAASKSGPSPLKTS